MLLLSWYFIWTTDRKQGKEWRSILIEGSTIFKLETWIGWGKEETPLFGAYILLFHSHCLWQSWYYLISSIKPFIVSFTIYLSFLSCLNQVLFSQRYRNLTNVAIEFMIKIKSVCSAAVWLVFEVRQNTHLPVSQMNCILLFKQAISKKSFSWKV